MNKIISLILIFTVFLISNTVFSNNEKLYKTKIELIKQGILAKKELIKSEKGKKTIYKIDSFVKNISTEKLERIILKIERIDTNLSIYDKYKNLFSYLEAKSKLKIDNFSKQYNYIDRASENIQLSKDCKENDKIINKIFGDIHEILNVECIYFPDLKLNSMYIGKRNAITKIKTSNVDLVNKFLSNKDIPEKVLLDYGQHYHSSNKLNEEVKNLSSGYKTEYLWGLNLLGHFLKAGSIKEIFTQASFVNLKYLNLYGSDLSEEDFISIANKKKFTNLETLILTNTNLKEIFGTWIPNIDKGIKILSDSSNMTKLKELYIGYNETVSDLGVKYLSESDYIKNLETLDLNRNNLTDIAINSISNSNNFKKIKYLDLSNNNFTDNVFKPLVKNKAINKIISLNLSTSGIGDNTLKLISENEMFSDLVYLDLSFNNISDKGIDYLSKSPYIKNLRILNLSETKITDKSIQYMIKSQNFNNVEALSLTTNGISVIGLRTFIEQKSISKLNDIGTNVFNNNRYTYDKKEFLSEANKYYINEYINKNNKSGINLSSNIRIYTNGDLACGLNYQGESKENKILNCIGDKIPNLKEIDFIEKHLQYIINYDLVSYGTNIYTNYSYGIISGNNNLYKLKNDTKDSILNLGDINICNKSTMYPGEKSELYICSTLYFNNSNKTIFIRTPDKQINIDINTSTVNSTPYNRYHGDDEDSFIPRNDGLIKINDLYKKDNDFVYYINGYDKILVRGANPQTFISLGGKLGQYGKDNKNVFFRQHMIGGADIQSFEYLGDNYSKDKNHVYYYYLHAPSIIKGANPKTFKIIGNGYSTDLINIFYYTSILNNADQKSFTITKEGIVKDKFNTYINGIIK